MTHHPADARPSCMVAALDTIKAAQKLKLEPGQKNRVREALPDLYWSLIAEAAIYADLARADYATGIGAGVHMTERDARTEERRERVAEAIRRKQNPAGSASRGVPSYTAPVPPVTPISEGDAVRVTRGDWAGRLGTVVEVYPNNEPPIVDVALFLRTLNEKPTTITVLPADVELIVGADQ